MSGGSKKKSGGRASGSSRKRAAARGGSAGGASKSRAAGGRASKGGGAGAGGSGGADAPDVAQSSRMSTRDIALDYAVGGLKTKADRADAVGRNLGETETLSDFLKKSGV